MTDRITVGSLRCEYLDSPLGIDTMRPRLSWQLSAARRGVLQSAYQVVVWRAEREDCPEWDSGKVASGESTGITYGGPELVSRQAYCWKVRVWDESGAVSAWGPVASWEMGLLRSTDWIATWIEPLQERARPEPHVTASENLGIVSPGTTDYSRLNPSQYLRKIFGTRGPVRQARIYATAHGVYRLEINGARVGGQELAPEVTAYDRYLQYQTYDVTGLIREGGNVLGAILGDGWYCGRIGLPGDSCQYGDRLALLLQLEIDYEDGSREWVLSDGRFRSSMGPLVYSDLFIGERYDARLEFGGWCQPEYDDRAWNEVVVADSGGRIGDRRPSC